MHDEHAQSCGDCLEGFIDGSGGESEVPWKRRIMREEHGSMKMQKLGWLGALILVLAAMSLVVSACGTSGTTTTSTAASTGTSTAVSTATTEVGVTPKIGFIYHETGIYSGLGKFVKDGVLMAIEDHGPLLGKTPEVIIRDDGTDVAKATAAAIELITKYKVDVIIGAIHTPTDNAIAEVADEYKIPFLYPAGGSTFMSGLGKKYTYPGGSVKPNPHPYMIYTWMNGTQRALGTVEVAKQYGMKWFWIGHDYEHGHETKGMAEEILQKTFGDKYQNVGESWPKQSEVDYTTDIAKALASGADVVWVCTPGKYNLITKQAYSQGLMEKMHMHWSYEETTSAVAAPVETAGVTATGDFSVAIASSPRTNEFAKKAFDKYGYWPGWPMSPAYQGTRIFLQGIEKAQSLDSKTIMRALEGIEDPDPITGKPFYIRATDHKSVQPLYLLEWVTSDEYAPGYWKILDKSSEPEKGLLDPEWTAHYDKMDY